MDERALSQIAQKYRRKSENVFIPQEYVLVDTQQYRGVFYYQGRQILGIPLEQLRIEGGLVVDRQGEVVSAHSVVEKVAWALIVYSLAIKIPSVQAYKFIGPLAAKSATEFQKYQGEWSQLRIGSLGKAGLAEVERLMQSISQDWQVVQSTTTRIMEILNSLWMKPVLEWTVIKNLYDLHGAYTSAGKAAFEKMIRLHDLSLKLKNGNGMNRKMIGLLSRIEASTTGIDPTNFDNALAATTKREMDWFLVGYRVPFH